MITNEKLILHGPVLTSVSGRDVEAVNVRKISYPANVVTFGIEVWRGAGGSDIDSEEIYVSGSYLFLTGS